MKARDGEELANECAGLIFQELNEELMDEQRKLDERMEAMVGRQGDQYNSIVSHVTDERGQIYVIRYFDKKSVIWVTGAVVMPGAHELTKEGKELATLVDDEELPEFHKEVITALDSDYQYIADIVW